VEPTSEYPVTYLTFSSAFVKRRFLTVSDSLRFPPSFRLAESPSRRIIAGVVIAPSQILDLTRLDAALAEHAPHGRTRLLPTLHAAQAIYGHLPEAVTRRIAERLHVPLADIHGVVSFYSMFYSAPVGRTVVRVCTDPACQIAGADALLTDVCARAGIDEGATSSDGAVTIERSTCLGLCNQCPAAHVTRNDPVAGASDIALGGVTADALRRVIAGALPEAPSTSVDHIGGERVFTALCGRGRRATLSEYEAAGGMRAWRSTLTTARDPSSLIDAVKQSGLMGRGGAAFPTGVKWDGAAKARGDRKFVVVNADESEPGTFKDRVLLEGDPCRPLEGALLAAYAIGARQIYFYVRGEYPNVIASVRAAIDELRAARLIGPNALGSGFDVDIELRVGAGAYICGEETALLESIEGERGFPRFKPPLPVHAGLFGMPTVIQNVETLAKVPFIIAEGPAAFRQWGTEKSTGLKLVCVSGHVARPGVYEIPFGATLRHVIDELAGGVTGGALTAVLLGGAAGTFAGPQHLDVKLTFEDLRAAGLTLGSGVIMVFNATTDLRAVLSRIGHFFAHESCGKCYPCQLGSQRQAEILDRFAHGAPRAGDVALLDDVGWTMTDASLCGLGQTAASAVRSAMQLWPDLFRIRT
jgi:NADH-quinone oxidoreductase subunit F